MQYSQPSNDLSCFRASNAYRGGNATLRDHYGALLDSGFSRFEIGNEYVRDSANSKHGAIYSDNGTFTSILEEPDADYSVYMRNQILRLESEIRKNGLWKVVLEMVPEAEQCALYLRKLWDDAYSQRDDDKIKIALATLIYYIVSVTLKRMKTRKAIQIDMDTEQGEEFSNDRYFKSLIKIQATEGINDIIKELNELRLMIETTISEISHEVPRPPQHTFSEISITSYKPTNPHDSVWSRMQDSHTQSLWSDFKDTLGVRKSQTVVDDMSAQAIIESVHTVHKLQYIYDLSTHEKTELLREFGLLYSSETATESPLTCQNMFSTHAASKPPLTNLCYTKRPLQCAVTRGNRLDNGLTTNTRVDS